MGFYEKRAGRSGYAAVSRFVPFLLLGACTLSAETFRNDGMAGGSPSPYFAGLGNAVYADGELKLPSGALHEVRTLPFPVKARTRYTFTFRGRIDGPHVIEEVYFYNRLFFHTPWWRARLGQPLAWWEIEFRDLSGRLVRNAPNFRQFHTAVMHRGEREYGEEFYTPDDAATAEAVFRNANREDTLSVRDVRFREITGAPTRNINPDFQLGTENYSGWNMVSGGELKPDPDRPEKIRLVLGTPYRTGGVRSDGIPVSPGEDLRFEFKAKRTPDAAGGARAQVFLYRDGTRQPYDRASGTLSRTFFLGEKVRECRYEFIVPDGVSLIRLYFENATVEYAGLLENSPEKTAPASRKEK